MTTTTEADADPRGISGRHQDRGIRLWKGPTARRRTRHDLRSHDLALCAAAARTATSRSTPSIGVAEAPAATARTYSLAREYADIAAVVDAAAAASGSPVDLLGHSYGGNVAFGAATRTTNIRRLVLYEGWPVPNVAHRTTAPRS